MIVSDGSMTQAHEPVGYATLTGSVLMVTSAGIALLCSSLLAFVLI